MSIIKQYEVMKDVIENEGVCNYTICNMCPIANKVNDGCNQDTSYREATKWIESLSEEDLFEILL